MTFILKLYDHVSQTYRQEDTILYTNIAEAIRQGKLSGRLFEVHQTDAMDIDIGLFKEMIDSCFTYGSAKRNDSNFKRFILPYEAKLGERIFKEIYEERLQYLTSKCAILHNVYTDCEGRTYNQLIHNQW